MADERADDERRPHPRPHPHPYPHGYGGAEGVDPDVDLDRPQDRRELRLHPVAVPTAVAVGGALGSLARWWLATPTPTGAVPWPVLWVNVTGCLAIGILLVLVTEVVKDPNPLVRPFLGTGVLGGYTTMSTYADQVFLLARAGQAGPAAGYFAGTLAGALLAVAAGVVLTRALCGVRPLVGHHP